VACSKKVAADADAQTRDCALMCEKSGYGIVTADKKFLKFDPDGNAKVLAALKASDKEDHLRVNVSGDVPGDTIKVTSVKLLKFLTRTRPILDCLQGWGIFVLMG